MQVRTRRDFLSLAGKGLGLAALSSATVASLLRNVEAATKNVAHVTPEEAATDEDFWATIQNSFSVTRGIINLNNGGVSPSPTDRDRGVGPLHLGTGGRHGLHDVANPRAAIGNHSYRPGRIVRLRPRRDRDYPQRFRVARDFAHGHGLQTRRRNPYHHAGLSADAYHTAPARKMRRP